MYNFKMMDEPETKKTLGQHWLRDEAVLQEIVQSADVQPDDTVLEIGAGLGTLTDQLLAAKAKVWALEIDHQLFAKLLKKYKDQSNKITIQDQDIRTYNLGSLPKGYKIVANIPYYLTANLLRILVDTDNKPQAAALLVQKEVAERVASRPGQMSFISVAVQLFYEASLGVIVPAELFTPPPKVDSQVLVLKKLSKPGFEAADIVKLIKFIKVGFSQPRKTLVNNLAAGLQKTKPEIENYLQQAMLKTTARAQELTLDEWHQLYKACNES